MLNEIELVALDTLHPNPKNAKEHSPEQIEQLRASIRRFGFSDPIGIDGEGNIIEGHGRYQAAVAEGLTEVPVIRLTHLSDKEREAYAIAHNQSQLRSGLELDKLKAEISALTVSDDDFISLGFGEDDVHFLGLNDAPPPSLAPAQPTVEESEEWNSLIQPVIKSTIRFASEGQYLRFMQLVDGLGARYPDEPRLSYRLLRFAREFHAIG